MSGPGPDVPLVGGVHLDPSALPVVALAVLGVLLLVPPRSRLARLPDRGRGGEDLPPGSPERAVLLRLRPALALLGVLGGWALVGGAAGVPAGALAGVAVWVVLGRAEDPAVVRRREQLVDDLPVGVDLLGACLEAGSSPEAALLVVADALGGPVGEELGLVHHRLDMGVDPARVWGVVARHPQLAPLGRAVGRAHESGASVTRAVEQLAAELRESARAEVESRARTIEVKAAAPLGLCLLPAFVVLGVVPLVVGVFSSMSLFG